jgi:enamine deaminase RidA (YjgF/YER057c/UK114 family)
MVSNHRDVGSTATRRKACNWGATGRVSFPMLESMLSSPTAASDLDPDGSREAQPLPLPAHEFVLTVTARPGEGVAAVFSRLATALRERDATVLKLMVYGSLAAHEEGVKMMRRHLGAIDWPVTWVEGASCDGSPLAGVQAFAIAGADLQRIVLDGRVVGSVFEDGGARHCLLGGLGPTDPTQRRATQAHQTFEHLETALAQAGFTLADVARTWFFNDDILAWYDDFNRVRTAHYAKTLFRSGSLPASTGVAGGNPAGAAGVMGAWAVQPLEGATRVEEVASPLQCPAPAYGSSFSRAIEIASGGRRRLLISGTASIAPGGETLWPGDPRKQIELTMEVIAAILRSREMEFGDVTRATAYFKHQADTALFSKWLQVRELQSMPYVPVHCDICRDDLLFELELDACCTAE